MAMIVTVYLIYLHLDVLGNKCQLSQYEVNLRLGLPSKDIILKIYKVDS